MKRASIAIVVSYLFFIFLSLPAFSQNSKDRELMQDAAEAKTQFIKADSLMQTLFENAYAYVIFPNIGKGAIGIGGAAGNGIVYQNGTPVGSADMKQLTVGFQFGGQTYREVIFFENQAALDRLKAETLNFRRRHRLLLPLQELRPMLNTGKG